MKHTSGSFSHETSPRACLPPSVGVLAGAGLRAERRQETQERGSKPAPAKSIINLGCWGRVTQSAPLALGNGSGASTAAQGRGWEMRFAEAPDVSEWAG